MRINGIDLSVKKGSGINGGKLDRINANYPYEYNKWRMRWDGYCFAPPETGSVLYFPGYPGAGSTIHDFSFNFSDSAIDTDEELTAVETGVDCDADATTAIPVGSIIQINGEYMLVGATGTTLTVTRAFYSSLAATHATNQDIYVWIPNHGAITGATWERDPSGLVGLLLDGTDDWINCGNNASTQAQQLLAMGWAKLGNYQISDLISHAGESASGWHLTFNAPDDIYMGDNYQAVLARWTPSTVNPFDGTWHHWAFYRDTDNLTGIICDGLERVTLAYAGVFGFGNLQIGRRSAAEGNYLKGRPRLVKLFGALSNTTILALTTQIYQQERHLFGT